ncbi:Tudor domain-containing protein 5 [Anthophora quadrimaculata]
MQVNSQKRENTKTTILALLLAHKTGCTLRQLNNDYYELEGESIPWKDLGYVSLLDFLNSMPKTVQIEHSNNVIIVKGIASDKSMHVSKLIAGQKVQKYPVKRKVFKPSHYYPKTAPQRIIIPAEIMSRIISFVNNHPDGVNKDYIFHKVQLYMPFTNITLKDMEEQLQELSHKVCLMNNKIYPVQSRSKNFNQFKKADDMPFSKCKFVSHNQQENKSVIVTVAGNEDSNMLNYDEEDGFELQPFNDTSGSFHINSTEIAKHTTSFLKETTFKHQDEISSHAPIIEDKESNSYKSFNCNNNVPIQMEFHNKEIKEENYSHKKDVEILINERVKFRLEKLIQHYPDGIWCADLPDRYLEEYKVSLNYVELGFNSVREFASQLPEIFHCVQPYDHTGDFKLYNAKAEIPLSQTEKKQKVTNLSQLYHIYETSDEEALPVTVSSDTCKKLIPDEVLSIGECVGYLNVADLVKIEDLHIEVIVVEVFTPSFFWIQLRKKQKSFKKFMDDLHNFYVANSESFVIPPVVLEEGLNCACMYNGIWHRAIIKTVKPDFQVTVLFYDYGTLKTYSPEAIYYLHRKFSYLPAQAIPCGLINVKPYIGSKWSRHATHLFAVKTSQIPLIATVASINIEDNSMMVTLTDTLGEEDVHINDWLIEKKLAEYGKMVCIKKRNFPFRYYLECQKRFKKTSKISGTCETNAMFKNKIALYNLNSGDKLSHKDSPNKVGDNKEYFCNELIANTESSKQLQLPKSYESRKNDTSIEKLYDSMQNSKKKLPRKLERLYTKLLHFKQKSIQSRQTSVENNEMPNSNVALSTPTEQNSHEEDENLCHNNVQNDNTKSNSLSADFKFATNEKNSEESEENYISEKLGNIPKQYANHFHIQDSDDELDINCLRTAKRNEERETKSIDWSALLENAAQENERESRKIEYKRPLVENCFLNGVYNSSYFAPQDNNIRWSPTGNITKGDRVSPLTLRNIAKRTKSVRNDTTIAIPKKMLAILTKEKFSVESLNAPEKMNHVQSIHSVEQIDDPPIDNFKDTDSNGILCTENLDKNSEDSKEKNYFCMETLTSRERLLKKLLSLQDASSDNSNLDSDDLSNSEKSISFQQNIDSDDKFTWNEYENDVDIRKNVPSEPYLKIDATCLSDSEKTEIVDFHTEDSRESMTSNCEIREKETLLTSSKTSVLTKNLELPNEMPIEPIPMQQSISTDESNSIKSSNSTEKSLVIKEMTEMQIVPVKEYSTNDTVQNISDIPVFNDIDVQSDEEEWDAHVSYSDLSDLLKINCSEI